MSILVSNNGIIKTVNTPKISEEVIRDIDKRYIQSKWSK